MALPVEDLRGGLFEALDSGVGRLIVGAPTGSGKSTCLPVMLLEKLGGRVLVLQPRRVAARMLARSVENLFGMRGRVGWHVRFDKHYGENTEIVFLTEGILARKLISDPSLAGVSAVVFDEFHERNIYADLSLALALRAQETVRPDLKIAVCSASMDSAALSEYLGAESRAFSCGTRLFDIDMRYAPPRDSRVPAWESAAASFEELSRELKEGNFLIFMPGAYEISRTVGKISGSPSAKGFDVLPLHGDLPPKQQDAVLAPSGRRKVIVSTNVAETSLTIDGVRCVIDSGLARVARFDPVRGVNTLLVERASLASAAQRAGRAGRTCNGVAVRLWRKRDEEFFERFSDSEISRLDLSQTLLWLKSAGMDFDSLRLFERPRAESVSRAVETLRDLGALDGNMRISATGRVMARFPMEPRCARLVLEGAKSGVLEDACAVAALAETGRIKLPLSNPYDAEARADMVGDAASEPEELVRLCRLAKANGFSDDFCRRYGIHSANARKVIALAADFERLARGIFPKGARTAVKPAEGMDIPAAPRETLSSAKNAAPESAPFARSAGIIPNAAGASVSNPASSQGGALARCVLSAFSDRLCVRANLATLHCRLSKGRGGEVSKESRAWAQNLFVAMELEERDAAGGASIKASLATPVSEELLRDLFPDDFKTETGVYYDPSHKRVVARSSAKFRDFILSEKDSGKVPADQAAKILRDEILAGRILLKNYGEACERFVSRVNFVAAALPDIGIPPIDESAKAVVFEQMCLECSSASDVKNADVLKHLRDWLSAEQLALMDYLAPECASFPNRRKPASIRYETNPPRAVVSARFRDFFDFNPKSLKICDGKILPTYEILAPNGRPVQTTQNLEEFWKTSWPAVKKELKSRYPKHFKADDKY